LLQLDHAGSGVSSDLGGRIDRSVRDDDDLTEPREYGDRDDVVTVDSSLYAGIRIAILPRAGSMVA
jgi:hypothetical protein